MSSEDSVITITTDDQFLYLSHFPELHSLVLEPNFHLENISHK